MSMEGSPPAALERGSSSLARQSSSSVARKSSGSVRRPSLLKPGSIMLQSMKNLGSARDLTTPGSGEASARGSLKRLSADRKDEKYAHLLKTDPETGLTTEEHAKRLQKFGLNELPSDPPDSICSIFLDQFKDPVVILLIIACIMSYVLGQPVAATTILIILAMNAGLGVWMEYKAGAALDALQSLSKGTAEVIRDGIVIPREPGNRLAMGDIVTLATGCTIPADIRLLTAKNLKVNEVALTGEPEPVKKVVNTVAEASNEDDEEKEAATNLVIMGTEVAEGSGSGIVVRVGMETQMGQIAGLIENADDDESPLQKKLAHLGVYLGLASIGISLVVFIVGMVTGKGGDPADTETPHYLQMLLVAVSLTVAAVPEGLPACVSITLAAGMKNMVEKNALIKKLHSVETLGSASVICTDKTGTLTAGVMTLVRYWFQEEVFKTTALGYDPEGTILASDSDTPLEPTDVRVVPLLNALLACANTTTLQFDEEEKKWTCLGNASERPIVVGAAKAGLKREYIKDMFELVKENPFSSSRKRQSNLVKVVKKDTAYGPEAAHVACVNGAPNILLDICDTIATIVDGKLTATPLTDEQRAKIMAQIDNFSDQAYRVLGTAFKPVADASACDPEALECHLTFVGLMAYIDPEREGILFSIEKARQAGVKVCMITGDYIKTAKAISRNVNLLREDTPDSHAIDCSELRTLGSRENFLMDNLRPPKRKAAVKPDDEDKKGSWCCGGSKPEQDGDEEEMEELEEESKAMSSGDRKKQREEWKAELEKVQKEIDGMTASIEVYARAKPIDKITIVRSYQRQGHVVAMTGDGVNDGPALSQANIGVAMGLTGTDVAKGCADMVLTDDNFVSIVDAIEEGRTIYANIGKFCYYLLSTNVAEVLVVMAAVLGGYPTLLTPIQILWLNLTTDGLPAIALAVEGTEPGIMQEGPRKKNEPLIEKVMITGICIQNLVLLVSVFFTYLYGLNSRFGSWGPPPEFSPLADDVAVWEGITNATLTAASQCSSACAPACYALCEEAKKLSDADLRENVRAARTMCIFVIVFAELFRAYTSRSLRHSIIEIGLCSNKYMQYSVFSAIALTCVVFHVPGVMDVFEAAYLRPHEYYFCAGMIWAPAILDELTKWVYRLTGFGERPKWAGVIATQESTQKKGDGFQSV